jgi:hypothetical protein
VAGKRRTRGNKVGRELDKRAEQVIMAGFFGAEIMASARTDWKIKLTGC